MRGSLLSSALRSAVLAVLGRGKNTITMMNVVQCSISLSNPSIRSGHHGNGILIIFYCNLLLNYGPTTASDT